MFPDIDSIDFRSTFLVTTIQSLISDCTRWTGLGYMDEMLDRDGS